MRCDRRCSCVAVHDLEIRELGTEHLTKARNVPRGLNRYELRAVLANLLREQVDIAARGKSDDRDFFWKCVDDRESARADSFFADGRIVIERNGKTLRATRCSIASRDVAQSFL